ncbi:energy-coupling factor transporter transmembrane protein EcfT [Staphylococcus muscae]|uniref:Energy-coupling factor transporter transmembrane protein EcfT n=1 Tax=Staphylococcus muscae TaxID=1294 RepID=A0A240C6S3_9STAP|nr:energy-coupling factor transporter transmembrane protein EcfT [Staphylococcus muscae]AVQ33609.1 energy-coupling factor transporter transmembrane protein EcfT [Staphylococcus muscae]PNZ06461.1 energy-coupling factor transporter transmembrane protein EcfT [Staphylococcus muscae]GGA86237.1 energy-coupling factor transporter transmembrane protein EcfT [Staphylococcus muscae]SNW03625.1 cobalt transport family protein [Staphylococcus muscae]
MKDKLIIGRYLPLDSVLHRLDPRSKFLFVFLFIIVIFFSHDWLAYIWLGFVLYVFLRLGRIPLWFLLKGLLPLFVFLSLTLLMHLFLTKGGVRLFEWGIISIDSHGLQEGLLIVLRLSYIMIISTILTLTTSPLDLTDAFDRLFKPLRYLKIPVAALSMMMAIALRFIPTLMEELDKIINAQKSRGAAFASGSLMSRIKAFVPLFIPLFISAFQRAEELAIAMEVRGYDANAERTSYRRLEWQLQDTVALFCIIPIAAVSLTIRYII